MICINFWNNKNSPGFEAIGIMILSNINSSDFKLFYKPNKYLSNKSKSF